MKRCLFLCTAFLIISVCTLGPDQAVPASTGFDQARESESLLTAQSEFLQEQRHTLSRIEEILPVQTTRLRETLNTLSPDISKLIRLKTFFRSSFREMLLLSQNLEQIEKSIQGSLKPLKTRQQELQKLQETLTLQRQELKEQFRYTPFVQNLDFNLKKLKDIDRLKNKAAKLEKKLEQAKEPAEEYLDKLQAFRSDLEKEVIRSWEDYYLSPVRPLYSADLAKWKSELSAWKSSLPIFVRYFLIGQLKWKSYIGHLAIFWPLIFAMLLLPCRYALRSTLDIDRRTLLSINLLVSLGLALILAYHLFHGFSVSLLLKTVWRLVLSLALVLLLPFLRRALLQAETAKLSPLVFLWALFGLALCLQSLVFSSFIKQAGSLLLFAGGLAWWFTKIPRFERHLERNMSGMTSVILGIGLGLSLGGWMHLALVVVTSWFVLCVGLYLGSVSTLLLKKRLLAVPDKGWGYVRQGAIQGIGVPLLWLLALGLVILWVGVSLGDIEFLERISKLKVGWGKVSINLFRLFIVFLGMYLTYSFLTIIRAVLGSASEKKEQIDAGTANSLRALTTYVVWAVYILFALAFIGVNLTSLTVVAGGLSVGIGFGLQSIVSNFISGLILLFGRSIRPGDIIQIGDMWAEVKEINIRTTEIETFDRSSILMPNSKLISEEITNWTYRDKILRRKIGVTVAYGSDAELIKRLLLYIADTHTDVLGVPAPFIRFSDFGEGALEFTLYFFAPMDRAWMVESELRFDVNTLFREYGIEFAIPQRGLHFITRDPWPMKRAEPESEA